MDEKRKAAASKLSVLSEKEKEIFFVVKIKNIYWVDKVSGSVQKVDSLGDCYAVFQETIGVRS